MTRQRRWLLGLEPIFEGGWLHKGRWAQRWDVEGKLVAVALFGDVTIDLAHARSAPPEIDIQAWAILRDVDVTVPAGTQVELTGWGIFGRRRNETPPAPAERRERVGRIKGRTFIPISDITVRVA